jgi:hypothetical protein
MSPTTGTAMQMPQRLDRTNTSTLESWKWTYQLTPSPELSLPELLDLIDSEKELQEDRGKRFKDSKSLFEDLDGTD